MRKQGLSNTEIARGIGELNPDENFNTSQFRAAVSIARAETRASNIAQVERMRNVKGMSTQAISDRLGIPEPTVRSYLKPGAKDKSDALKNIADMLQENVDKQGLIQIGSGVENHMGITNDRLKVAVAMVKERGYEVHTVQVDQLGTKAGQKTLVKVLAPPGTTYLQAKKLTEEGKVYLTFHHTEDNGRTILGLVPPLSISSRRVGIRYKEDGGEQEDGVIYVRRGVEDVSLGGKRYAQVRILINDTHYMKGMAIYKDDMPDGVDLVFNTNKSNTGSKLDALKPIKEDDDNPFGSYISRQLPKLDKDGREIPNTVRSAMNIVNEEGAWEGWKKTLSSQMLSKQKPALIKQQLDMTYDRRVKDLEEISSLTNPTVRKKLLREFSEETDTAAAHLKAAGIKDMGNHVILPLPSIKPTEVYAPNFKQGSTVVLIRFPHGGTFEIPELRVNNNHREGKSMIGQAKDAIGINPKTAQHLSGADFDGDSVLVIPNPPGRRNRITTSSPLQGLKNFDPQAAYPGYPGMKRLDEVRKQVLMGEVSNLITDMTLKGATHDQLARAVRHSMVVIDAAKHGLNYKESEKVNGIRQLKDEFQGPRGSSGASTIISRKGSATVNVPERKTSYTIDPTTGKKVYRETGASYVNEKGETVKRTSRVLAIRELDNVAPLSSGTVPEKLYVDYSNRTKALANEARKQEARTSGIKTNPSAKKVYASDVESLRGKLNTALQNRPLERQAQIVANANVSAKVQASPDMTKETRKKVERQALEEARTRTGAKKTKIQISDSECDAIQAGAVSNKMLTDILNNADMDRVRDLATPKSKKLMTSSKQARAAAMLAQGYTQAQVAEALGVSLTTLKNSIGGV
jgi:DNA-binding CsgD family transcriptional regulator